MFDEQLLKSRRRCSSWCPNSIPTGRLLITSSRIRHVLAPNILFVTYSPSKPSPSGLVLRIPARRFILPFSVSGAYSTMIAAFMVERGTHG